MQNTSALWKRLWAGGAARLEAVAEIGGREYAAISAPVISRALTQDGLSVGNAVSASCQLAVLTEDSISRAAEVVVRMRLCDGESASEWRPAGTFYVSHRTRDAVTGLTTLECYDAMLKANAEYDREGQWPRSMAAVAAEIAEALGVELDPRTRICEGQDYSVTLPEAGATMRDVLCGIASVHGGNWALTPENRLRLVALATDGNADAAAVSGVTGGISAGAAQTITGLRVTGGGEAALIGSDAGLVLEIDSPYATDGSLAQLSQALLGASYQPYALRGAIYDPAAELGDAVRAGANGEVVSALFSETATLGLAFRGDIAAPEPGELADEYPYIPERDKAIRNLADEVSRLEETKASDADLAAAEARMDAAAQGYASAARTGAEAVTRALDAALDQQGVFNRLTNDGETQGIYLKNGKLYINGTYIDTGTLNADLITAGTIADASGDNYWILAGANSEFVTNKGVIGEFTLENGALQYGSQNVGGNGSYIGKNGISYNQTFTTNDTAKTRIIGQGVEFYWNGARKALLYLNNASFALSSWDENDVKSGAMVVYNANQIQQVQFNYQVRAQGKLYVVRNASFSANCSVTGDLTVSGTKSRAADAGEYGKRLLYCYETPSPLFGDVGEGIIAEDGRCYVWLDAVLAQTVDAEQYQVFLQPYGAGACYVAERSGTRFVVEGAPGLAFGWEIKARQRDFDQRRLERAAEPWEPEATDYGAEAARHIQQLQEGRVSA